MNMYMYIFNMFFFNFVIVYILIVYFFSLFVILCIKLILRIYEEMCINYRKVFYKFK